jgi:hypothetical protein
VQITATISEERFSVGTVNLYVDGVLKDTEHDSYLTYSWDTTSYANVAHTIRITASDTVGNTGQVQVVVYVQNVVTSGSGGGEEGGGAPAVPLSPITGAFLVGGIGIVAVVGIAVFASRRSGGKGAPAGAMPLQQTVQSQKTVSSKPRDEPAKKASVEKIMIACPFCGAKNEKGLGTCQNCGAEL